jgi:hypothetical protein
MGLLVTVKLIVDLMYYWHWEIRVIRLLSVTCIMACTKVFDFAYGLKIMSLKRANVWFHGCQKCCLLAE